MNRCEGARRRLRLRCALRVWSVAAAVALGAAPAAEDERAPVAAAVPQPDAEVNLWLVRATAAAQAGKPDEALPFIVRILKTDPATLGSTDGVVFRPARKLALALLNTLPEPTRAAYQVQAETSASCPAGQLPPPTDLTALETLYRTGLPGARAAAEAGQILAALYLDQGRFFEARRVLNRLLDELAPEGATRSGLLARLVLACARIGDETGAAAAWTQLQNTAEARRWAYLRAELRPPQAPALPVTNAWTMAYAGPAREGVSPGNALELEAVEDWALRWGFYLESGLIRDGLDVKVSPDVPQFLSLSVDHAATRMTVEHRRPSDDVIFAGNRAWINGFNECVALDLETGRLLRRWAHVSDDRAKTWAGAIAETWVFDNRLNRAASLVGGSLYAVEDNYRAAFRGGALEQREWNGAEFVYRPVPSGNALAAYDPDTGRRRWRVGRELPVATPDTARGAWRVNAIRFAAAPLPCGNLLVAPVEDDSGLGMVGLDSTTGAFVWRTRLSAGFPSARPRAAPVLCAADGTHIYVVGGSSVSALDAHDGSVQWTSLDRRQAEPPADAPGSEANSERPWEESLVQIVDDMIVAMPENSAELLAFDRRQGTRRWAVRKPAGADYVVGRRGMTLIVAGAQMAAGVDLTAGREQWRTPIEGSTGRGALYGRQVWIPCGRRILRLRAEDGAVLEPARSQTLDGLPLGNLFVNGNQLLVTGLERVYALVDARPVFARLDERLKRQPSADAYAERGARYAGLERCAEASADLREAWTRQRGLAGEEPARRALLRALWQEARQNPARIESCGAEARHIAVTPAEQAEVLWQWAQVRDRAGAIPGALALWAEMAALPDLPLAPNGLDRDWEASVHGLAARQIRSRLANRPAGVEAAPAMDPDPGWGPLEAPAAQALARLGADPERGALVELAMFFPGTRAGAEAAVKAAQGAAGRGDLGIAETILQRIMALTTPANRVVLASSLVQLYERMNWPKGVARLRDHWPQLGGGAPAPDFLARATTNVASGLPLPPWRLRWRTRVPARGGLGMVGAGLYYTGGSPPVTGCLDPETGRPRWELPRLLGMTGDGDWADRHLLLIYGDNAGGWLDAWSGAVITHPLLQGPPEWVSDRGGHYRAPMSLSRFGLATVRYTSSDRHLAGLDALTGRVTWRRGDADVLVCWYAPTLSNPATRMYVTRPLVHQGPSLVSELDLWTGEVTGQRVFSGNEQELWSNRMYGRHGCDDPAALGWGTPVLEQGRLTVKNLRTGATLWSSAPELAIAGFTALSGGLLAARGQNDELALLDGEDGRTLFRSGVTPFAFPRVSWLGEAVLATRAVPPDLNEVMAIDPREGRLVFHGRLSGKLTVLMSFGARLPNHLLALKKLEDSQMLVVVNEKGESKQTLYLPRHAPLFMDGLLLMYDYLEGDLRAYEHDPDGGAKAPPPAGADP